jgi:hypothetical protein
MLRLFLTVGISVASCERSFSKLKIILKKLLKINYESAQVVKPGDTIYIEQDVTIQLDFDNAINEFTSHKA